jgi:hypothetical protein
MSKKTLRRSSNEGSQMAWSAEQMALVRRAHFEDLMLETVLARAVVLRAAFAELAGGSYA